jgi:TolB-like protein
MGEDLLAWIMKLEFHPFVLDMDRAELRTATGLVKLEPKAFRLLQLLAENNDRVVSKEEMIATVWSGRFVSDAAVATALKSVRQALGDDGKRQHFIRTLRGMGHRFVAPVQIRQVETPVAEATRTEGGDPTPQAALDRPTVAVLPFTFIGASDDLGSLGDALPADVISSLSRLRWLRVIARQSSFRFRDRDVDLMGLRTVLRANYCLSGRVELFRRRLIVGVELVDTRSGTLIWSERFERPLSEVHAIRHDTVAAVVSALDLQIPQAEAALARLKPVDQLDAWQAYHLGMSHVYRFNARDNAIAGDLFRRATELAPGFAPAFAAKAFSSFQDVVMGYAADRNAALAETRAAAERSMELDPLEPYANEAMGRCHLLSAERLEDGLVWLDRAIELSPNFARGHYSRGFLNLLRGEVMESRKDLNTSLSLSPLDPMLPPLRQMIAYGLGREGRFDEAAELAVLAARTGNAHIGCLMCAVAMCHLAGRADEAGRWARVLKERRPDATIGQFLSALPFDKAFAGLLRHALRAHRVRE